MSLLRVYEPVWKSAVIGLGAGLTGFFGINVIDDMSSIISHVQHDLQVQFRLSALETELAFWKAVLRFSLTDGFSIIVSVFLAIVVSAVLCCVKVSRFPLINRLWPIYPAVITDRLVDQKSDHIGIVHGKPSFSGRESVFKDITSTIRNADKNGYLVISGEEGIGKTRICIELMRYYRARGWDVGFLHIGANKYDVAKAAFRRNTLIVIDDADLRIDVWTLLERLLLKNERIIVILAGQFIPKPPQQVSSDGWIDFGTRRLGDFVLTKLPYRALQALKPTASLDDLQICDGNPGYLLFGADNQDGAQFHANQLLHLSKYLNAGDLLAMSVFCGPLSYEDIPDEFVARKPLAATCLLFRNTPARVLEGTIPSMQPSDMADELAFLILDRMDEAQMRQFVRSIASLNPSAFQARISRMWRTRRPSEKRRAIAEQVSAYYSETFTAFHASLKHEARSVAKAIEASSDAKTVHRLMQRLEMIWLAAPDDINLFNAYADNLPKAIDKLAATGTNEQATDLFHRFVNITTSTSLPKLPMIQETRQIAMAALLAGYRTRTNVTMIQALYLRCREELELALPHVTVDNASAIMQLMLSMMFDAGNRKDTVEVERLTELVTEFMDHPACGESVQLHRLFMEIAKSASASHKRLHQPNLIEAWLTRAKQLTKKVNASSDTPVLIAEAHLAMELMLTNASLSKVIEMEEAAKEFRSIAAKVPLQSRKDLVPLWSTMASAAINCYRDIGRVTEVERWARNIVSMPLDQEQNDGVPSKDQRQSLLSELRMISMVMESFLESDQPEMAEKWSVSMAETVGRRLKQDCAESTEIQMEAALMMIEYYARNDTTKLPIWGKRIIEIADSTATKWNPNVAVLGMKATKIIITAALVHGRYEIVNGWQDTADAIAVRYGSLPEVKAIYNKIRVNRKLIRA